MGDTQSKTSKSVPLVKFWFWKTLERKPFPISIAACLNTHMCKICILALLPYSVESVHRWGGLSAFGFYEYSRCTLKKMKKYYLICLKNVCIYSKRCQRGQGGSCLSCLISSSPLVAPTRSISQARGAVCCVLVASSALLKLWHKNWA